LRYKSWLPALLLAALSIGACNTASAAIGDTIVKHDPRPFGDFIGADGALTVFPHGDYVEPYSAIKALIAAHRMGVDVAARADIFTTWIMPFQQANGPFPRICRSNNDRWLACGPSDADDSLSVLWCAVSAEILPGKRTLDAPCERALENLQTQWEPEKQTFRAIFGGQAAYFADNVEVMMFLNKLRHDKRFAKRHAAALSKLPAQKVMDEALRRNYGFDPDNALEPTAASVPPTPYAFYPYGVAPIYPLIYDWRTGSDRKHDWKAWREKYRKEWLAGNVDHFPWGLVAWAALKSGDTESARAWLRNSPQWEKDGRWNIMEEGVQLGLHNALKPAEPPQQKRVQ
jgi:hypothetical protein